MVNKKEMKERVKKSNKGFSLVELIVVIAIMAILVGVVGTQVLPYMEKSREAKDLQVVSAVCTAATTAFSEHAGEIGTDATFTYIYSDAGDQAAVTSPAASVNAADNINAELKTLLGVSSTSKLFNGYFGGAAATNLESKKGKSATSLLITYSTSSGTVSVQLKNSSGNVLDSVSSK